MSENGPSLSSTFLDMLIATSLYFVTLLILAPILGLFNIIELSVNPILGFTVLLVTSLIFAESVLIQNNKMLRINMYVSLTIVGFLYFGIGIVGWFYPILFPSSSYLLLSYVGIGYVCASSISGILISLDR